MFHAPDVNERISKTKKKIIVTSALPYVNGVKHLGNLIGSLLPADIFHRYLDLMGKENIYICGTDEHGTPAEVAAMKEGMDVREYCDKYHSIQKEIYRKWGFDFTHFGRTSSPYNHKLTQDMFLRMWRNGYVVEKTIRMPFCRIDKRFLPDRFIEGTCPKCGYEGARGDQCEKCGALLDPEELINPRCTICGKSEIEFREEKHLFLDLSKLESRLKEWIERNTHWPSNTRNFALGWIKEGLRERCITRNLKWGVKVPLEGYEDKVFYVWFDAPIGYASITWEWLGDEGKFREWWEDDSLVIHFLGKDNIPFHTVFWPGIIMAADRLTLPYYVAGYEYLNWEGKKFSTSRGVGLFSDEALELFPADYWRFYLLSILPETKDSNFSWDDFGARINSELVGNYSNLFYRVVSFINRHFGGRVGKRVADGDAERLARKASMLREKIEELIDRVKLREILREVMAFSSEVNAYFQHKRPWELVKEDREKAASVLNYSLNFVRIVSQLLKPVIPGITGRALEIIGKEEPWESIAELSIGEGHVIGKEEMLARKIDVSQAREYSARKKVGNSGKGDAMEKGEDRYVSYEEFGRMDIRIAKVVDVKDHPNADKLYILKIKIGDAEKQIVSGLKGHYSKEELLGRHIVVLNNLKPRKFRGEVSEGMLLAADDVIDGKEAVVLLVPDPSRESRDGMKVR